MKRGKVTMPMNSELWDIPPAAFGLLLHLHRAVIVNGDIESGELDRDAVKELVKNLNADEALKYLIERGLVVNENDVIGITTWHSAQGTELLRQKEKTRKRVKNWREKRKAKVDQLTCNALRDQCNALHTDKPPKVHDKAPNREGVPCNALHMSDLPNSPLLLDLSQNGLLTEQLLDALILIYSLSPFLILRSSDPSYSSDIRSYINIRGSGHKPVPTDVDHGFVGGKGQGLLMVDDVDEDVRHIAKVWSELEPFTQLKDPRQFLERILRSYPDINVLEESYKIDTWWYSNPSKRKTKRGIPKFLNLWFSNAQTPRKTVNAPARKPDPHESTAEAIWSRKG